MKEQTPTATPIEITNDNVLLKPHMTNWISTNPAHTKQTNALVIANTNIARITNNNLCNDMLVGISEAAALQSEEGVIQEFTFLSSIRLISISHGIDIHNQQR